MNPVGDDDEEEENNSLFPDNTVNSGLKNGRIFKGSHIGDDSYSTGTECGRIASSVLMLIMLLPGSILLGNLYDMLGALLSKRLAIVVS